MNPPPRQARLDQLVQRAAAQLYAFGGAAAELAAQAALLADDGLRSAGSQRSGAGGHADPTASVAPTPGGAIAVRVNAYLEGVTDVVRRLEQLDRERHALVQTCRPAGRPPAERSDAVHCEACDQPVTGRRRSGYGDCCYQAWRRWPRTSDPGRDRFTFEAQRRDRPDRAAAA